MVLYRCGNIEIRSLCHVLICAVLVNVLKHVAGFPYQHVAVCVLKGVHVGCPAHVAVKCVNPEICDMQVQSLLDLANPFRIFPAGQPLVLRFPCVIHFLNACGQFVAINERLCNIVKVYRQKQEPVNLVVNVPTNQPVVLAAGFLDRFFLAVCVSQKQVCHAVRCKAVFGSPCLPCFLSLCFTLCLPCSCSLCRLCVQLCLILRCALNPLADDLAGTMTFPAHTAVKR